MNRQLLWIVAAVVAMTGCASTPPPRDSQLLPSRSLLADSPEEAAAADQAALLEDEETPAVGPKLPAVTPGSGQFVNPKEAGKAPPDAGKVGEVTFNFEGESLHAVIKTILGEILQQNYVVAPGVQGTVTFATAKPLRGDQALSILEMLLRWNNATLVWQDGRYTILPVAQAVPGNLTPRTGPVKNARGFEVRAVPLQFISATEMEKIIKPYAKSDAVIYVDAQRNMIVLGGTQSELENYLQTIAVFDVDWLSGMSVGMYSLQQAEASKVVTELEKIFGEGGNTPIAGMFRFMPLEAVNGVLVITPQKKYLKTIEQWLERFDLGAGEAGTRLYVYDVKNVKASDLATIIGDVFGTSGGGGGRSSGSVAPGLQPARISSVGGRVGGNNVGQDKQAGGFGGQVGGGGRVGGGGSQVGGGLDSGGGGGNVSVTLEDDVKLSSVEESNSLIVRATPAQWESIKRVIERLDVVPLQVVIEAQIISVELNDSLQYGVRWFFENAVEDGLGADAADLALTRRSWTDLAGSVTFPANSSVMNTTWSFVGRNAGALVNLLDGVTDLRVLAAPSLVVLNNKVASINSGTSVPITTTSVNPGTGGTTGFDSVQYLQTGINLTVTPRVNPGGLVFLEIDQEDSTPQATAGGGNPPISQSNIRTAVAVQSGETVMLGGLIKQTDRSGTTGFPGLSRIPVIGGLFGTQNRSSNRQELLVLITPKVIRNADEARRITENYSQQFRALEPLQRRLPPASEPVDTELEP